jgi:O-antigen ligase
MLIPLIPVGIVVLAYLLRRPEVAFALFLFSYVLEGGVMLPWFLNLTLILFSIAVLGFVAQLATGKKNNFKLKAVDLWLWGFVIILFAGSYLAPDPEAGFIKALRFTGAVFGSYLLARIFLDNPVQIYRFLRTIFVSAAIICSVLIIIALQGESTGRMFFIDANPIPVATFFAVGLILAVIEVLMPFQKGWKFDRVLCAILIPVFLYGIFLTGVRGPLIAAGVGLTIFFSWGFIKKMRPHFRTASIATLILAAAGLHLFREMLPNIAAYSPTALIEGLSTIERLEQYALVASLFSQSPLLGVGTNGFVQLTGWAYPHNIFLEVAVENGLVGLIFFVIFLSIVAGYGFRFLTVYYPFLTESGQKLGLMVLTVGIALLVGRQFSFGLDMHKDLFAFLGLVVNLPLLARLELRLHRKNLEGRHELQKNL